MKILILLILAIVSCQALAEQKIEGVWFITKAEYHQKGKPCACPSDPAQNGRCGNRAALCKNGGYNILDCGVEIIKSIQDYKKVKKQLCRSDF